MKKFKQHTKDIPGSREMSQQLKGLKFAFQHTYQAAFKKKTYNSSTRRLKVFLFPAETLACVCVIHRHTPGHMH